jgi:uncharacterized protein (TIGR03382 family)
MSRRLRHIVPVVLAVALAAGPAQASEPVLLRSGQSAVPMVLAEDELHIDGEKGAAVIPGVAKVTRGRHGAARVNLLGSSRSSLQAAARNLLSAGAASEALPVLYLNGNRKDSGSRVLATRRIVVAARRIDELAAIARDHKLRLREPLTGTTDTWIMEPEDTALLAALDAAITLQGDARVRSVEPVLMLPLASRAIPNDPLIPPITPPPGPIFPNTGVNSIEGQWHLDDNEIAGLNVKSAWTAGYTGVGANINLVDGGVDVAHEDLVGNVNMTYSRDYLRNDALPNMESISDYHGTAMAGLLSAVGDNGVGVAGVAWGSKLFVSKVLPEISDNSEDRRSILNSVATPNDRLRTAITNQLSASSTNFRTWAIVCAWGPVDNGQSTYAPDTLTVVQGLRDAGAYGRGGFGSPIFWAAGNGGHNNPNASWGDAEWDGVTNDIYGFIYASRSYQDCASFDGYLNRHVIPIAGHTRAYAKSWFSEYGPNLIASAPAGPPGYSPAPGICTTDPTDTWTVGSNFSGPWTGLIGWMNDQPDNVSQSGTWFARNSCNFDTNDSPAASDNGQATDGYDNTRTREPLVVDRRGVPQLNPLTGQWPDPNIRYRDPDNLAYENGAYVPPKTGLGGTSYAAALAGGAGTLMMQARPQLHWRDVRALMVQRSQDRTDIAPFGVTPAPHDPWGWWLPNKTNLVYNNRYGFGALDVDALINGGNGGAVEEPGALDWPLMPAMLTNPVSASYSYTLGEVNAIVEEWITIPTDLQGTTPPAIDAGATAAANAPVRNNFWTRTPLRIDPTASGFPDNFRVEAVEVDVELTTPSPPSTAQADSGNWHFLLVSPPVDLVSAPPNKKYGTTAYLGRQRPGTLINQNGIWKWTFTSFVHWAEPAYTENPPVGTTTSAGRAIDPLWYTEWQLLMQDESFLGTPYYGQIKKVDLRLYGFQTYPNPTISTLSPTGVAIGETNTLTVTGSGFRSSAGNVNVTQGYWNDDATAAATAATPVTTSRSTSGDLLLTIPSALIPATPGEGAVWIANPAIPLGRSTVTIPPTPAANAATAAAPTDAFDRNDDGTPSTIMNSPRPAGQAHMKVCGTGLDVRYSHRPTLTGISDITFPKGGGSITVTTNANDQDVAIGAGFPNPETLTVSAISLNPYVIANQIPTITPGTSNGIGTYAFNITSTANAGLALVQVTATDGVLTATRTFRVVILSDKDASGCGGGMGLALLGIPLVAWLLRRRRR